MIAIKAETITEDIRLRLKPKGFMLLCYFLCIADKWNEVRTSYTDISEATGIKKTHTAMKYLKELIEGQYIEVQYDITKIDKSVLFKFKVNYSTINHFRLIPKNIFKEYILSIKDIGWSILCLLSLYFNKDLNYCYLNISRMSEILNLNKKTIILYLSILEELELIQIKNIEEFKFKNKHVYIVSYLSDY